MEFEQEGGIKSKQNKIKLLSRGTYGCIFKPALTCKGGIDQENFITKVQRQSSLSNREVTISEKIKKIPHYNEYFAPILKTCTISVANISGDEIKKCEFMKNNKQIISNKLRYVGKNTLEDHFIQLLRTNPALYIETVYDSFFYLLKSIRVLFTNGIVHFDMKENNIMYDEGQNIPIIIDFGISFDTNMLENNLSEVFYTEGFDYPPWCFEIALCSYIVNSDKKMEEKINIEKMKEKVLFFIKSNALFELMTETERKEYMGKLNHYIENHGKLTYKEFIHELCKSMDSWDMYALAVIYMKLLYITHTDEFTPRFIQLLKDVIFAAPNERSKLCKKIEDVIKTVEATDIDIKKIKFDEIKRLRTKRITEEKLFEKKKYR
jgi:serine/threonine protein kinase